MKNQNCIIDEHEGLSMNIVVREENSEGKTLVIVNNEELGIADFGDTIDEAISNFRKSAKLYLDTYPDKKELLREEVPLFVSRILI